MGGLIVIGLKCALERIVSYECLNKGVALKCCSKSILGLPYSADVQQWLQEMVPCSGHVVDSWECQKLRGVDVAKLQISSSSVFLSNILTAAAGGLFCWFHAPRADLHPSPQHESSGKGSHHLSHSWVGVLPVGVVHSLKSLKPESSTSGDIKCKNNKPQILQI